MRGTTYSIYALIFRAQAVFGLGLVAWLMTSVLLAGLYAGISMIVGVIAGVVSLACVWPFLTPGWLGRPSRRGQAIPLVGAHVGLMLLYSFVAISAVFASNIADDLNRQLAVGAVSVLGATAILNIITGLRLCFASKTNHGADETGTVTELVLPQAGPRLVSDNERDEEQRRLSRAS